MDLKLITIFIKCVKMIDILNLFLSNSPKKTKKRKHKTPIFSWLQWNLPCAVPKDDHHLLNILCCESGHYAHVKIAFFVTLQCDTLSTRHTTMSVHYTIYSLFPIWLITTAPSTNDIAPTKSRQTKVTHINTSSINILYNSCNY